MLGRRHFRTSSTYPNSSQFCGIGLCERYLYAGCRYANSFCVQRFDKLDWVWTASVIRSAAANLSLLLLLLLFQHDSSIFFSPEILKPFTKKSKSQGSNKDCDIEKRANTILSIWNEMKTYICSFGARDNTLRMGDIKWKRTEVAGGSVV